MRQNEEAVQPLWYDLGQVHEAWALLTAFADSLQQPNRDGQADGLPETLRYDLVNVSV